MIAFSFGPAWSSACIRSRYMRVSATDVYRPDCIHCCNWATVASSSGKGAAAGRCCAAAGMDTREARKTTRKRVLVEIMASRR